MDGDVSHEDGERRAAGLDYREGSPAASRSEEEDRELVLRRRGAAALDLRLLRRRQVAFVDPALEVETLDAVRRDEARRGALKGRCALKMRDRPLVEPGRGTKLGGSVKIESTHTLLQRQIRRRREQPTRTRDEESRNLDLLPRRHVGRRRPQNRVELRLGRRQIIEIRVAERF